RKYCRCSPRQYYGRARYSQDSRPRDLCDTPWAGNASVNRRSFLLGAGGLVSAAHLGWFDALAAPPDLGFRFADVTAQAGIQFKHNSGAFGGKFLPETLGSGCAFLDYDSDGWQDILLVNGTDWPGHKRGRSMLALYHNNRNGTFTDVTRKAGLDVEMYGM